MAQNINQLVWSEDSRPEKLDDIKGQKAIAVLKGFVRTKNVVDCTFAGPAGVGKTTAVKAMAKELYGTQEDDFGVSHYERNFKVLNASDERGIDVVKTTITDFTTKDPTNKEVPFLTIYLDEADGITPPAQDALRATIEAHSSNCRFILSCNNSFALSEALRSRGPVVPFTKIPPEVLVEIALKTAAKYSVTITEDALLFLVANSDGDARLMLKTLQMGAIVNPAITIETLKTFIPSVEQKSIDRLLEFILTRDIENARNLMIELYETVNSDPAIILRYLSASIIRYQAKFPSQMAFLKTSSKIGEATYRIRDSEIPLILLLGLISDIILINQIPIHCVNVKE